MFLNPWDVFCPYEPPYYLEDADQQARKRREVSNRTLVTWISQSKAKSKLMYLGRREFLYGFVSHREKIPYPDFKITDPDFPLKSVLLGHHF